MPWRHLAPVLGVCCLSLAALPALADPPAPPSAPTGQPAPTAAPALGQPTWDDLRRLQQMLHQQESRLRDLETERLPPVDGGPTSTLSRLDDANEGEATVDPSTPQRVGPANLKPTQKWSGRVHFDYWPFPSDDPLISQLESGDPVTGIPDFIGFRRLRFGVGGDVGDTMLYKIEMEFASPEELAFKDAYLGWDELPLLGTVLMGNQKRPYGLDHLNSSRYNVFLERPFHVEAFNQDARRIGLQAYQVTDDLAWNTRFGVFLMDDLAKPGGQRRDNYQSEVAGRIANTIWYDETSDGRGYAHWAVSGSLAFPGGGPDARFTTRPEARTGSKWIDTGQIAGGNRYALLGLEGVVNVGPWQLVAEYQGADMDRTNASNLQFGGGYVYLAYFLTGEHTPWNRRTGTLGRVVPFENFFLVDRCGGGRGLGIGAWQVAARYSYGDFSDDDIFGGVGSAVTLGMNWWWTAYSRMQFNYIHGQISERAQVGGAPLAPGLGTSGEYDLLGTRFMVDF